MIFEAALPANRAALRAAAPRMPRHRGRRLCVTVRAGTERAQKVLIVNTKKGGHAFVGLYLATELQKARHTVTILNDGDSVRAARSTQRLRPACAAISALRVLESSATAALPPAGRVGRIAKPSGADVRARAEHREQGAVLGVQEPARRFGGLRRPRGPLYLPAGRL